MEQRWNPRPPALRPRRLLAGLFAIAIGATLASPASASQPQWCMSGSGARGYSEGYELEKYLLDYVWMSFDCDTLEDYVRAVDIPLYPSSSSSTYLQCRDAGIADAIVDSIYEKQASCVVQCSMAGADQGRLNARIYCGIPAAFSTNESLSLCSTAIWQSCRGAFSSYVNDNCSDKRYRDPAGYDAFLSAACRAP